MNLSKYADKTHIFVLKNSFADTLFSVLVQASNFTLFNLFVAFVCKYVVYNFLCVFPVDFVRKVDKNTRHCERNRHVEEATGRLVSSEKVHEV